MENFKTKQALINWLLRFNEPGTINRKVNSLVEFGGPISIFDLNDEIKGTIHTNGQNFTFVYRDSILMY